MRSRSAQSSAERWRSGEPRDERRRRSAGPRRGSNVSGGQALVASDATVLKTSITGMGMNMFRRVLPFCIDVSDVAGFPNSRPQPLAAGGAGPRHPGLWPILATGCWRLVLMIVYRTTQAADRARGRASAGLIAHLSSAWRRHFHSGPRWVCSLQFDAGARRRRIR